jgi:hypothetical protein
MTLEGGFFMFHSLRDWMEALPDALNPKQPLSTSGVEINSGSLHKCELPPDGTPCRVDVLLHSNEEDPHLRRTTVTVIV